MEGQHQDAAAATAALGVAGDSLEAMEVDIKPEPLDFPYGGTQYIMEDVTHTCGLKLECDEYFKEEVLLEETEIKQEVKDEDPDDIPESSHFISHITENTRTNAFVGDEIPGNTDKDLCSESLQQDNDQPNSTVSVPGETPQRTLQPPLSRDNIDSIKIKGKATSSLTPTPGLCIQEMDEDGETANSDESVRKGVPFSPSADSSMASSSNGRAVDSASISVARRKVGIQQKWAEDTGHTAQTSFAGGVMSVTMLKEVKPGTKFILIPDTLTDISSEGAKRVVIPDIITDSYSKSSKQVVIPDTLIADSNSKSAKQVVIQDTLPETNVTKQAMIDIKADHDYLPSGRDSSSSVVISGITDDPMNPATVPGTLMCNCGKVFKCECELYIHKCCHAQQMPYQCGECGEGFITYEDCYNHLNIHKEEGKLKTEMKDSIAGTTEGNSLNVPFSPSSLPKPRKSLDGAVDSYYFCSLCKMAFTFSRRGNLKVHLLPERCMIKCFYCGCSFSTHNELDKHRDLCLSVRPQPCSLFESSAFRSNDDNISLTQHVHTGINNQDHIPAVNSSQQLHPYSDTANYNHASTRDNSIPGIKTVSSKLSNYYQVKCDGMSTTTVYKYPSTAQITQESCAFRFNDDDISSTKPVHMALNNQDHIPAVNSLQQLHPYSDTVNSDHASTRDNSVPGIKTVSSKLSNYYQVKCDGMSTTTVYRYPSTAQITQESLGIGNTNTMSDPVIIMPLVLNMNCGDVTDLSGQPVSSGSGTPMNNDLSSLVNSSQVTQIDSSSGEKGISIGQNPDQNPFELFPPNLQTAMKNAFSELFQTTDGSVVNSKQSSETLQASAHHSRTTTRNSTDCTSQDINSGHHQRCDNLDPPLESPVDPVCVDGSSNSQTVGLEHELNITSIIPNFHNINRAQILSKPFERREVFKRKNVNKPSKHYKKRPKPETGGGSRKKKKPKCKRLKSSSDRASTGKQQGLPHPKNKLIMSKTIIIREGKYPSMIKTISKYRTNRQTDVHVHRAVEAADVRSCDPSNQTCKQVGRMLLRPTKNNPFTSRVSKGLIKTIPKKANQQANDAAMERPATNTQAQTDGTSNQQCAEAPLNTICNPASNEQVISLPMVKPLQLKNRIPTETNEQTDTPPYLVKQISKHVPTNSLIKSLVKSNWRTSAIQSSTKQTHCCSHCKGSFPSTQHLELHSKHCRSLSSK